MTDINQKVTQIVEFKGKKFHYTWNPSKTFIKNGPINHIECVVQNDLGQLLVMKEYGKWSIPGGAPNDGESPIQAISREVREEVNILVTDLTLIGYNTIKSLDDDQGTFYHLVYKAKVLEILHRVPDPESGNILDYKFVDPKDVSTYVKWGNTGAAMFKLASVH